FPGNGLTDYVEALFGRFHYLAPFTVLFLCGLGLPLPEEVALIGAGILLYQDSVEFVPITLTCSAAILLGDSVPYWIGRHWGLAALRGKWLSKILHPERFAKLERRFTEHGNWVVFSCRFMPGLRIPGYFVAGTLGMSYWRFLLLDGLGVLVSVPTSIWLGKMFGGSIDMLRRKQKDLHLILAFAVAAILIVVVVRMWRKKREGGEAVVAAPQGSPDPADPHRMEASGPGAPPSKPNSSPP
ncbi:MAG: DedA family protein, partial [Planctomycetota bacterium]